MRPDIADDLSAALRDSSSAVAADSTASAREIEMDPNYFALAALGLAVVGAGLSLGADRRRAASLATVAGAGALALLVLKSDVVSSFRDLIRESQEASRGAANPDAMAEAMAQQMFGVQMKEGWVLALALFLTALALNAWRATRKPEPAYVASPTYSASPPQS